MSWKQILRYKNLVQFQISQKSETGKTSYFLTKFLIHTDIDYFNTVKCIITYTILAKLNFFFTYLRKHNNATTAHQKHNKTPIKIINIKDVHTPLKILKIKKFQGGNNTLLIMHINNITKSQQILEHISRCLRYAMVLLHSRQSCLDHQALTMVEWKVLPTVRVRKIEKNT